MARFGLRIGVRGPVLVAAAHGYLAVDTQPDLESILAHRSIKNGHLGVANFDTKYHPKRVVNRPLNLKEPI